MADHDFHYQMFPMTSDKPKSGVPGWAIIGIFVILLFYFIADAREFLMPVMLAFLLFFVFVPFRRFMKRRGIGATTTATIVTLGMVVSLAGIGWMVSGPAGQLMADAPRISQEIEQKLGELRGSFRQIEEAAEKIDELSGGGAVAPAAETPAPPSGSVSQINGTVTVSPAAPATSGKDQIKVEVKAEPSTMDNIMSLGPSAAGQMVFTLILLFFLLSSGDLIYLKIVQSFDKLRDKRAAYMALREIEDSLGAYLGAITIINAGLGVAIGLAMWAWGMPSPLLFGLAGFLLNYIPYIGAIMGAVISALVALVALGGVWEAAMVAATFVALTSIEGQFITPYFVSRRLQLNTIVVFITVALWAWLWSVLGMIVAVPVLVVLRVLADHIPGLEKFGNFLAGEAPPDLEEDDEDEDQAEDADEDIPSATAQLAEELLPGATDAAALAGVSDTELEAAAMAAAEAATEAEAAAADAASKARLAARIATDGTASSAITPEIAEDLTPRPPPPKV